MCVLHVLCPPCGVTRGICAVSSAPRTHTPCCLGHHLLETWAVDAPSPGLLYNPSGLHEQSPWGWGVGLTAGTMLPRPSPCCSDWCWAPAPLGGTSTGQQASPPAAEHRNTCEIVLPKTQIPVYRKQRLYSGHLLGLLKSHLWEGQGAAAAAEQPS